MQSILVARLVAQCGIYLLPMKRLLRSVFNVAAVVSAVLFVGICVLWGTQLFLVIDGASEAGGGRNMSRSNSADGAMYYVGALLPIDSKTTGMWMFRGLPFQTMNQRQQYFINYPRNGFEFGGIVVKAGSSEKLPAI